MHLDLVLDRMHRRRAVPTSSSCARWIGSGAEGIRRLGSPRTGFRYVAADGRRPGRDLFKFVDDGEVVDVRRRHLNAYLREVSGQPFSAKDFRTWAGTLVCASELCRCGPARTAVARKRAVRSAVDAVAQRLGNTPAVARGAYVSPAVFAAFARGRTLGVGLAPGEVIARARGLHAAERALVALLRATQLPPATAVVRLLRGGARTGPAKAAAGATAKPLRRAARGPEAAPPAAAGARRPAIRGIGARTG